MSGANLSISVEVLDATVRRAFASLEQMMGDTTPVMRAVGTGLVSSTHQRFASQTDPEGARWIALNPAYASGKRNSRILTESGRLRSSINARASNDRVEIGTNVIYAAVHQFGATIRPVNAPKLAFRIGGSLIRASEVTLPARPFLGISSQDEAMIADVVFGFIERYSKR